MLTMCGLSANINERVNKDPRVSDLGNGIINIGTRTVFTNKLLSLKQ